MVHLIMHLADEVAIAGPAPYRWMYPIKRYLQTLKKYLWNKSYPKGSMEQGYLVEYLSNVETRRNRKGRNANGIGRGVKFLTIQVILRVQVNKYILTKMFGTNVAELSCSIAMKFSPF
ncbi:PREDICTED: LOC107484759 isoform [Prunus dulcis]|uniref:PREDICTED: LOC107484759 isoform n=1 Tax=Prunus dulcis TaxID=3755 RepID=A0A5E4GAJ6_PRUDU|nr:PREDICTED: LOC107484759 isoform [Prunus dulcis]